MPDGWEVQYGLDPTADDAAGDLDVDDVNNLDEYNLGIDPNDEDSDDDGMTDGYEVANSLDPTSNDAGEDGDSDTYSNLLEYQHGSDPQDPNSIPAAQVPLFSVTKIKRPNDTFEYTFFTVIHDIAEEAVILTTPNGEKLTLDNYYGDSWVVEIKETSEEAFLNRFSDGDYVYNIYHEDSNIVSVTKKELAGDFPDVFPNIISPSHLEEVDPNDPILITWDQWHDSPLQGKSIWLSVTDWQMDSQPVEADLDADANEYTVPAQSLSNNGYHQVWLEFSEGYKKTVSWIVLSTGEPNNINEYLFGLGQRLDLSTAQADYFALAEIECTNDSNVTITTPAKQGFPSGETISLELKEDEGFWGVWELVSEANSLADLEQRFPDGTYTFTVAPDDSNMEMATVFLDGNFPGQFPSFVQPPTPTHESIISESNGLTIEWQQWLASPSEDKFIWTQFEDLTSSVELFDEDKDANETQVFVYKYNLYPDKHYQLAAAFVSSNGEAEKFKEVFLDMFTGPRGWATINSTPTGARIVWDIWNRKDTGNFTPSSTRAVLAGTYTLVLQKEGFYDWIGEVTVNPDEETVVDAILYETIVGDITGNGSVGLDDLKELAEQWLQMQPSGNFSADIAPQPDGDGIVNFLDYAVLAGHWLESVEP
jgi:hypothetical protein